MNIESILDLEIFEAVCKEGNFAKAAQKTKNSVPSVSKRISRLERSLKITLFERTTRSIRLTEAGQNFLVRTERVLAELREAEKETSREKELKGKIRMTAPLPFATRLLPDLISEFGNLYSEISIEVIFENEKSNLITDKFDLALRITRPLKSARCIELIPNPVIAVAHPAYLERVGTPTTLEELANHKLLFVEAHSHLKLGKKKLAEINQDRQIRSNNGSFLCEYAASGGEGILFRSYWDVEGYLRTSKLRRVLPNRIIDSRTVGCLLLSSGTVSKRVSKFCGFLQEKLWIRFPELKRNSNF